MLRSARIPLIVANDKYQLDGQRQLGTWKVFQVKRCTTVTKNNFEKTVQNKQELAQFFKKKVLSAEGVSNGVINDPIRTQDPII